MRRKRLNHAADTLCAMFCGWRLMNSYKELAALGSGTLEINALNTATTFNGSPIEAPSIAHELHIWLVNDLAANDIPSDSITIAVLEVQMEISRARAPKNNQRSFYIGKDGMPIHDGEFFKLSARCKSNISTSEANYSKERGHYEQWPVRWPD